jgi:uncharacterized protein
VQVRLVFGSIVLALGCGSTAPEPEVVERRSRPEAVAPRAEVVFETEGREVVSVDVEVAANDRDRGRGLMYRRYLAPSSGMLFVFDDMERREFWMSNTFISLDVFFIDDQRRVVGVVENARPLTRDDVAVDAPSKYVLEVRAGFARAHDIGSGASVRFVGVPGLDPERSE